MSVTLQSSLRLILLPLVASGAQRADDRTCFAGHVVRIYSTEYYKMGYDTTYAGDFGISTNLATPTATTSTYLSALSPHISDGPLSTRRGVSTPPKTPCAVLPTGHGPTAVLQSPPGGTSLLEEYVDENTASIATDVGFQDHELVSLNLQRVDAWCWNTPLIPESD